MTEDDFRRLAGTFGSDMKRWPEKARDEAEAFAATAAGRNILARESLLDADFGLLAGQVEPARIGAAIGAVTARIGERRRPGPLEIAMRWLLPPASFAAAGALGVFAAVALTPIASGPEAGVAQLFAQVMSFSDSTFARLGG